MFDLRREVVLLADAMRHAKAGQTDSALPFMQFTMSPRGPAVRLSDRCTRDHQPTPERRPDGAHGVVCGAPAGLRTRRGRRCVQRGAERSGTAAPHVLSRSIRLLTRAAQATATAAGGACADSANTASSCASACTAAISAAVSACSSASLASFSVYALLEPARTLSTTANACRDAVLTAANAYAPTAPGKALHGRGCSGR